MGLVNIDSVFSFDESLGFLSETPRYVAKLWVWFNSLLGNDQQIATAAVGANADFAIVDICALLLFAFFMNSCLQKTLHTIKHLILIHFETKAEVREGTFHSGTKKTL